MKEVCAAAGGRANRLKGKGIESYMKIIEELRDAKTIGIGGHIRPDGDCVGSVMGLYLYLKKELPEAQIVFVKPQIHSREKQNEKFPMKI